MPTEIAKKDTICVSMTTWDGDYMKTIVHMMSRLSSDRKVLFVNYGFTWKDVIFTLLRKANAPIKRILGFSKRIEVKTHGYGQTYVLHLPPLLPVNWIKNPKWYHLLNKINHRIIARSINRACRSLDFVDPMMINAFNPVVGDGIHRRVKTSQTIYYCYDEISAAEWCNIHGTNAERSFAPIADQVIVSSVQLLHSKRKLNPNISLIKNGVDYELFRSGQSAAENDTKVIGYLGSVDSRLDYDLLELLIRKNHNFIFRFVGRVTSNEGRLRLGKYKNVEFTGSQPVNTLPDYVSNFDVCLIPFVRNDFTKSIYPLKINEYLAAGKPVVCTDFTDLSDFEELVYIAENAEDFNRLVEKALNEEKNLLGRIRKGCARNNSWDQRIEMLRATIDLGSNYQTDSHAA
jgi:glycosyltransferase involved in cell wall biosynthesis